jgi:mannosyltransferase
MKRLTRPTIVALAIVALGFGLRLYRLDAQSFWYDEAYSAEVAEKQPARIFAGDFGDNHPPFHSLALHYWGYIGKNDFLLRFLSVMAGTLGIAAVYSLGQLIWDGRVGLMAAGLTAILPYQVYYSQEVRLYSTLFLAATLLLITYRQAVSSASRRWWLAYACCAVWGVYVQYWIAFVLLAVHVHLACFSDERRLWTRMLLADLLVAAAFMPWVAIFLTRALTIARGGFWPETPGLAHLLSAPYGFTLSTLTSEKLVPLAFATVLFLFVVTHLQVARQLAGQPRDREGLVLLLSAFWCPVLLTFLISQWRSVYLERSLIVATPPLYLLLAWGAVRTRERLANLVLLLLLVIFATNGLINWYLDPAFGKPPFRAVAELLRTGACGKEPVVHTSDGAYVLLMHYAPQCEHFLVEGDPAPELPVQTFQRLGGQVIAKEGLPQRGFWLVVALDNSIEFQTELADWIDHHSRLSDSRSIDGITLRHYASR